MRKNMDRLADAALANDTDRVIEVLKGGGVFVSLSGRQHLINHLQRPVEHVTLVRILNAQTGVLSKKKYAYLADTDLKGGTIVEVRTSRSSTPLKAVVQPRHLNPISSEDEVKAQSKILRVLA